MRLRMRIATGPAAGAQDAEKMLNWGLRLRPRALR